MSSEAMIESERVGAHYDAAKMLETRDRSRAAIAAIAAALRPGMTEGEGRAAANAILRERGLRRGWHGVHVRFGVNTLKPYDEESDLAVVLGENDIFFVDIGPVWGKWEGDAGESFVVGDDPEMHAASRDVKAIFEVAADRWRKDALTGAELYAFAAAEADRLGWVIDRDVPGHRLGDFPHEVLHAGHLADVGFRPSTGLWVLEIQIRHPTRPFGAFYEDLLID